MLRVSFRRRVDADGAPTAVSQSLSYWKKSIAGAPLTLHASDIYALIEEGIYTGSAPALSSRSFVERMGDVSLHVSFTPPLVHC